MALFSVTDTSVEALKEVGGGGKYISKSGIYTVTLKTVSVKVNDSKARSLNFNVDYEGSGNTLYGLKLDNNDGTQNFQYKTYNNLAIIADLANVQGPVAQTHNLGKDNTPTELQVLEDFSDIEVQVRVQEEYSLYKNELQSRKVIKAFYRADGASAAEIASGSEVGVQLKKDEEYAQNVTYKDGLDKSKVDAMKEAKAGGKPGAPTQAPTISKNLFS